MTTDKVLMKGNEAFAEAAIRGGARLYFGYPITPQSEVPEYMSRELPKHGGTFIQAESELGAINMAYGAGAAGGSVFISSSSPGIALMQEGMSFLCSAEVPLLALNVSRGGPGIGGIQPGQADYYQVTRGGGNGDYRILHSGSRRPALRGHRAGPDLAQPHHGAGRRHDRPDDGARAPAGFQAGLRAP